MRLFLSSLFVFLSYTAQAYQVPALTGPVMDQVGIISPSAQKSLSDELFQFKAKTGVQIQVFVAASLNDEVIESVAIQIFDQWKLGDEKKDNGVLFLIAPNERKMRIEVGQGLEGAVPDVIAKRIIAEIVRPHFQQGQMSLGILQGVEALQHYIVTGEDIQLAPTQTSKGKIPSSYLLFGFIGFMAILFVFSPGTAIYILLSLLSGGRGGYGGGRGGGGWSGGGGRSSGGGASGGW